MTKIITHSGIAHLDDFLSACLILYKDESIDEIIRQDVISEEDLNNSSIWKIDISEIHDSSIKAFDHHQEGMNDCAFSLLLKYWDVWENAIEVYSWVPSVVEIDSRGLGYFLANNKISHEIFFKFNSFVERSFIELFQRVRVVSKKKNQLLFLIMKQIGKQFFRGIDSYQKLKDNFESQVSIIPLSKSGVEENLTKGIPVLIYLTKKPEYSSHLFNFFRNYIRKILPEYRGSWVAAFSYDRPENSIYLKRYGNPSHIDFSRIKSLKKTYFAHEKGFVAIVENMYEEELSTYIQHALL